MKKLLLASAILLVPAFSYAATIPTVVVVNHTPSGTTSHTTIVKIPVGQAVTLVKAAPAAALMQKQDKSGQVTEATAAVVKPLFIEHIETMPNKDAQHAKSVIVKVTYTFNYRLGVAKSDASGNQQAVLQKENTYTNTVTKTVPYGQVETVKLTLPPSATGSDETLKDIFSNDMFLTISANK